MIRFLYYFEYYLGKIMYKLFRESLIKKQLFFCGKNVHISQNCNIKGVTINQGCIIGAGSVVTNSTEPYGIYAGVPAKKVKDRFNKDQIKEHKKILKI